MSLSSIPLTPVDLRTLNLILYVDLSNIGNDKQLAKALLYSYDPLKDSALLKESPEKFYYFRSHYPLRREYIAYSIANADSKTASLAKGLGFNIE